MPEVTGELLSCSDCSAVVRFDGGLRDVEIENDDGKTRRFQARRATTTTPGAPATVVEPIFTPEDDASSEDEEFDMATKKATKAKAP